MKRRYIKIPILAPSLQFLSFFINKTTPLVHKSVDSRTVASSILYSQLFFHRAEQVECLQRGHVVEVGLVQLLLQG